MHQYKYGTSLQTGGLSVSSEHHTIPKEYIWPYLACSSPNSDNSGAYFGCLVSWDNQAVQCQSDQPVEVLLSHGADPFIRQLDAPWIPCGALRNCGAAWNKRVANVKSSPILIHSVHLGEVVSSCCVLFSEFHELSLFGFGFARGPRERCKGRFHADGGCRMFAGVLGAAFCWGSNCFARGIPTWFFGGPYSETTCVKNSQEAASKITFNPWQGKLVHSASGEIGFLPNQWVIQRQRASFEDVHAQASLPAHAHTIGVE